MECVEPIAGKIATINKLGREGGGSAMAMILSGDINRYDWNEYKINIGARHCPHLTTSSFLKEKAGVEPRKLGLET